MSMTFSTSRYPELFEDIGTTPQSESWDESLSSFEGQDQEADCTALPMMMFGQSVPSTIENINSLTSELV
jgi:hypothetical protein